MAQLPTIASTSNRRVLPTADLKVDGATPAAFGSAVGAGLQAIGEAGQDAASALGQFQLAKQQEAERLAEFDRQATFVEFGSAESTRLEEARRNIEGPAQDFTRSFMGDFDTRAAQFLEAVPERNRDQWRARMTTLRSGLATDALRSEFAQRDAWSNTKLTESLTTLQNGAAQSPAQLDGWRRQGEELIAASLLSPQAKAEAALRWRGSVAVAAAQGDVTLDPEGAIRRLGGVDHVTALEAVEAAGGGGGGGAAGPVNATGNAGVVVSALRRAGRSENVIAGFLGNIQHESGFAHNGPPGDGGSAHGLAQWRNERVENFRRVMGVDVRNSTVDQQARFINWELDHPEQAGMTLAQRDAILNARSPEEAARLIDQHYERSNGRTRDQRAAAARRFAGSPPRAVAAAARPGGGIQSVDPNTGRPTNGPIVSDPTGALAATGGAQGAAPAAGATDELPPVDPRYADIPLDARMQLIGAAQREIDRREGVQAAVEQQQHDTWLNQFMNDLNDGKAGAADIEAARNSGRLTDFDEINRAEGIVEQREAKTAALNLYNSMVAGNAQFNPYDDNQRRAVDAAVAAAGNTPQAAFDVWQRTGIMAKQGAVALRGALISTDEKQVASAASIASNMLARNPNAFAGVEGGDDIERSALLYSHYVNDLGYSPQEAVRRVAQQNTPEMRRRFDANREQRTEFRKTLARQDVGNMLSNAFGGWFSIDPEFTAPEQRAAAAQDYADLAEDHYARSGDPAAAQSYALAQMKKLYGVANGRLMKFPPTRAYPAINGSQSYIFEQAAADVKGVTGRNVRPEDIYLMPIPTATAEAFRAGRATPYSIHYIDRSGGQTTYRVLNGRAFVADVRRAQQAGQGARRAEFERGRQRARDADQFARDARIARFGYLPGTPEYDDAQRQGRR